MQIGRNPCLYLCIESKQTISPSWSGLYCTLVTCQQRLTCRHFEDLTSTDDEFVEGQQQFTESGRLALHSESKRQEALEAQEIFAGSPMMAAPAVEVEEPNQIDEPTVLPCCLQLYSPATPHPYTSRCYLSCSIRRSAQERSPLLTTRG